MNILLPILDITATVIFAVLAVLAMKTRQAAHPSRADVVLLFSAVSFQVAAFALRWSIAGYPPVVAWQHAVTFSVLIAMSFLLLSVTVSPSWSGILPAAGSLAALLTAWASFSHGKLGPLPLSLRSGWLFVHGSAAALAQAAFLIAASAAIMRLVSRQLNFGEQFIRVTEEYSIRAVIAAVLFWGAMIIGGALWADAAWGRYWGWDPVEVWSLLIWLLAALHVHLFFGWKSLHGKFLAVYSIILMLLARFALWAIAALHQTIHWYGR